MHINGSTPKGIGWPQRREGSTYEAANQVGSHPVDALLISRARPGPSEAMRSASVSALLNERSGSLLEKISDPRSADALVRLQRDAGPSADHSLILAAYGENS